MEFFNRNSPHALLEWMYRALDKSDITAEERTKLGEVGARCIAGGGWRGDVCDRWRELGYGSGKIEDWCP